MPPDDSAVDSSVNILVMNAGSSSHKVRLYRIEGPGLPDDPPDPLWEGKIEWSAPGGAERTVTRNTAVDKATARETLPPGTARADGVSHLLEMLWRGGMAVLGGPDEVAAIGHRVVHGGRHLREPMRVTPDVMATIQELAPLAPEHNPAACEGMEITEKLFGQAAPGVAVFDTAFHRTIPDAATVYPGPYAWVEQGIRRYGFHGISHAWCAERAARMLVDHDPGTLRLICCHLGNGCSLAAVRGGQCVDTTMGFTPMEGLMMGSRAGSIDPGVLLHLLGQHGGPTLSDLGRVLNEESGLKGLSGVSEDLRAVLSAIDGGDERARLALDVYIHRLCWHIGAMTASLGGLDALVFTAGVGENSAVVRRAACRPFAFLGLALDEGKNAGVSETDPGTDRDISRADSRVRVLVIPAHEEWAVARECWRLTFAGKAA
ncbi:MAG: acetate kinase [Akkermansiaceae bacterium]|nr:acetate kinase [Armatimonadota bacterium]